MAEYIVDGRSRDAADDNPGSARSPLRTIGAALERAGPGDTVIVRPGIYRELVSLRRSGEPDRPVTVRAEGTEPAIVSGAEPVAGWEKWSDPGKRPIWRRRGWGDWASYGANVGDKGPKPLLAVDGVPLLHVGSPDELIPGSFCYTSEDGGTIYLWPYPPPRCPPVYASGLEWWTSPANLASSDPNEHLVEAGVRHVGIRVEPGVSHVVVRGIAVRFCSGGFPGGCAIEVGSDELGCSYVTIEDCSGEYCCGSSVSLRGDHIVLRRSYFRHNGISGGAIVTESLVEDCVFDSNSERGISHGWSAGAIKFLFTAKTTVRRCQFLNNDGPGLWFDWGNSDNVIEGNLCAFNYGPGIMMEVSPHFESEAPDARMVVSDRAAKALSMPETAPAGPNVLRNNICYANRWDGTLGSGILLQLASNTIVVNNTVVGNERYGIFVRYHPYHDLKHRCTDNTILNNIVCDNGGGQIHITPVPADKPIAVARNRSDYNLFWDSTAWRRPETLSETAKPCWRDQASFERWGKTMSNGTYSLEEWQKMTGLDLHSIQREPGLVSPRTLDFRLLPTSPAIAAGVPTPYATDDFLGRARPADRPPSMGALEYLERVPQAPPMPMR